MIAHQLATGNPKLGIRAMWPVCPPSNIHKQYAKFKLKCFGYDLGSMWNKHRQFCRNLGHFMIRHYTILDRFQLPVRLPLALCVLSAPPQQSVHTTQGQGPSKISSYYCNTTNCLTYLINALLCHLPMLLI